MRIFTSKVVVFCLSSLFLVISNVNASGATYFARAGGSWNSAIWATTANGAINTSIVILPTDDVVINDDITVNIDVNNVLCANLKIQGTLNLKNTLSLIVSGVVTLDQGLLNVGNGYFYVGDKMHVIANGNDDISLLSVDDGIVIVQGSVYFWKDAIGGATNGSDAYRLLKISDEGTITLGGKLEGANGTDVKTLSQTVPSAIIFKGGTNNNSWSAPANWSGTSIPKTSDVVYIPAGLASTLENDQPVKTINMYPGSLIELGDKSLIVSGNINNSGGNITSTTGWLRFNGSSIGQELITDLPITLPNIELNNLGGSLRLKGEVKVSDQLNVTKGTLYSNGKLTLLSTGNKTANVGPLLSGADILENVNVQVFMSGQHRGYRLISSPIDDRNLTEKTFKQLQKYIIITGPGGTAAGFDQGGSAQPEALTLNLYNEATGATQSSITPIRNIADPIAAGRGFYAFFRGKQMGSYLLNSPKLNAPFATPEDVTVTYTGPINKFSQAAVALSNSQQSGDTWNGYNLVGNPYPSTIDYEKIPRGSAISDQLVTLKPNGSAASYKQELKVANNGGTQYIQPGQAFFLVAGTNSSVSFEETHKASSIHSSGFLSAPKEPLKMTAGGNTTKDEIFKMIKLNLQDNLNTDEATIVFQEGRSANADFDDVLYFSGSSVSLASISADNKKLAINIMPAVKVIKEIKLSVNATSSGLLKLNFSDLSGAEGYQVLLKDALLPDSFFDVKANPVYAFNIDKSNYETYGNDRFSIIFKPEPIAAPILFTADKKKLGVELNWVSNIATEIDYFEVEVSTDKVAYTSIGKVRNASRVRNSEFSFLDRSPVPGIRFYRLKQFNKDGSFTYTDLRVVDILTQDSEFKVHLYPNPAIDKIQISLPRRPEGTIDGVVFNRLGQPVKNFTFAATDEIALNLTNWGKGIYFLELRSSVSNEVIVHSKFVVGL